MSMSKTFIGGAVRREFESEAPAAEEMLDRVVYAAENSSVFKGCVQGQHGRGQGQGQRSLRSKSRPDHTGSRPRTPIQSYMTSEAP